FDTIDRLGPHNLKSLNGSPTMALIKFAPLSIPLHRRLETAAVALYYYSFFFGALIGFLVIIGLLYTSLYPIALFYLAWAYLFDSGTPSHGGRRSKFMRRLKVWQYFRDYFPISLIKTAELDPQRNYIFGYHPHGILCAGAFCNFATEATNFSEIFPGVTPHLLPLMGKFCTQLMFTNVICISGSHHPSRDPTIRAGIPPSQPGLLDIPAGIPGSHHPSQDPTIPAGIPPSQPGSHHPSRDPTIPAGIIRHPSRDPRIPPSQSGSHHPSRDPTIPAGIPPSQPGSHHPSWDPTIPAGIIRHPSRDPRIPPSQSGSHHPSRDPTIRAGIPPSQPGLLDIPAGIPGSHHPSRDPTIPAGIPPSEPGSHHPNPGIPPSQPGSHHPSWDPTIPAGIIRHPSRDPRIPPSQSGSHHPSRDPTIRAGIPPSQPGLLDIPAGIPGSHHPSQDPTIPAGIPPSHPSRDPTIPAGIPPSQPGLLDIPAGIPGSHHPSRDPTIPAGIPPSQPGSHHPSRDPTIPAGIPPSQPGSHHPSRDPTIPAGIPPSQPGLLDIPAGIPGSHHPNIPAGIPGSHYPSRDPTITSRDPTIPAGIPPSQPGSHHPSWDPTIPAGIIRHPSRDPRIPPSQSGSHHPSRDPTIRAGIPPSQPGLLDIPAGIPGFHHPSRDPTIPAGIPPSEPGSHHPNQVGSQLGYFCHPGRDRWDPAFRGGIPAIFTTVPTQRWDPSWDLFVIPAGIGGIPPSEVGSPAIFTTIPTQRWDPSWDLFVIPAGIGGIPPKEVGSRLQRWDPGNIHYYPNSEVGSQLGSFCHPGRDSWDPAFRGGIPAIFTTIPTQRWDPSWDLFVIPAGIGGIPPSEVGSRQYSLLSQLRALFRPPLFRDYIMSSGMCNVSKESCDYVLTEKGPGNSIVIVVGGAAESLDAHPGSNVLTLKEKYGFIKLALKTGSSLVPTYAFGENDVFYQVNNPRGSMLRKIQTKIQQTVAFAPCVFYGRGIFQYTFGLLPHRRPINVVVGAPIDVDKCDNPTREQVQELHDKYEEKLVQLFEDHKCKYGLTENDKLIIL
ncbi:hypothetical protein QZH41_016661, partial [Actinostola sp. cb2023]